MSKRLPAGEPGGITPKDVFDRSNMPSWWERLTGVAPKIPEDRMFLAFVAARYSGEPRLPHPDALVAPDAVRRSQCVSSFSRWACLAAAALLIIGLARAPVPFSSAFKMSTPSPPSIESEPCSV